MGLSYEDYIPQLTAAKIKVETERVDRERVKAGVAAQLREILVDPRWDLYAQQVEDRLQVAKAAADSCAEQLLKGQHPERHMNILAEYRYYLGLKEGLEVALNIARETTNNSTP